MEYKLVTSQAGQLDKRLNEEAEGGFSVYQFVKDGNHFYALLQRSEEVSEVSQEADELWDGINKVDKRLRTLEKKAEKIPAEE